MTAAPSTVTAATSADVPSRENAAAPEPVLTDEHFAQRDAARQRRTKIDRAAYVATVSAWSLAAFAALSLPFALFSVKGAFVAIGLAVCAFFEFRGRNGLKQLDPAAPIRLAWNQFALACVIAGYCAWSAYAAWTGPSPYAQAVAASPELADTLAPLEDLIRQVTAATYGLVGVLSVAFQVGAIAYYRTRRKHIVNYVAQTPAWVLALDRPRKAA